MLRLMFEKTDKAVWISHLDLMRVFQRAFKRAGLSLTHTQGFNPRPSVSIALPLSVGVHSKCELLDFELENVCVSPEEIQEKLNEQLISGVRVLQVYSDGMKIKDLSYLKCQIAMHYDRPVCQQLVQDIQALFHREVLMMDKKTKNGVVEQDIIPMIHSLFAQQQGENSVQIQAIICCQNPSLNPNMLVGALQRYLPQCAPDDFVCTRLELYDKNLSEFR